VLHESNFFSLDKKSKIDGFLTGEEELFRAYSFALRIGDYTPTPVRTEKGYCILSPFEERPFEKDKPKDFVDSIPALENLWKSYMTAGATSQAARYMVSEISKKIDDEKMDFAKAAETVGFKYKESSYFKLTDKTIPEFPDEKNLIPMVFEQIDQRIPASSPPLEFLPLSDRDILIYREADEKKPTEEEYLANLSAYSRRLASSAYAKTFEEWLRVTAKKANIEPTMEKENEEKRRKEEAQKKNPAQ
jgi:hypothetical protein